MFRDREDAAHRLAERLRGRPLRDPVVLGIPRGGVVLAAVLARELGADLDVVLARKLRAPGHPELALGAVAEDGHVYLNELVAQLPQATAEYLEEERRRQTEEIARRRDIIRAVRPKAPLEGRSVVVTDDGLATGATMMAALQSLPAQGPHEVIVAVPVAAPGRLEEIADWCDETICPHRPHSFRAVGEFYRDFRAVEDETVIETLRWFAPAEGERRRS